MENKLTIYNTLTRKKELFEALNPPHVGMYVCGPTVYGDPHLGHARPAITFDILFRYLQRLGYKVRYVRNITDVGQRMMCSGWAFFQSAKSAGLCFSSWPSSSRVVLRTSSRLRPESMP